MPQEYYPDLYRCLTESSCWSLNQDEVKYMLRYVAHKFEGFLVDDIPRNFHFSMKPNGFDGQIRKKYGVSLGDTCTLIPTEGEEAFRLTLDNVQLYAFSTGVAVLALGMTFEDSDPMYIAAAQYYLKKISREALTAGSGNFTLLDIARELFSDLEQNVKLHHEFFVYSFSGRERANFLTFVEMDEMRDYSEELFYLRHNYTQTFRYKKDENLEKREVLRDFSDRIWGISAEAAAVLFVPDSPGFGDEFYKNFNQQYLLLYVILLHQKYFYYMMLTSINEGETEELWQLEEYKRKLYEFESDFVFSKVTEVDMYQTLYSKVQQVFGLESIYKDVYDPLEHISDLRTKEQEKNNAKLDGMIQALSVLVIFSALVDSFDFLDEFVQAIAIRVNPALLEAPLKASDNIAFALQMICTLGILIFFGCLFEKIRRIGRKDKENRKNKENLTDFQKQMKRVLKEKEKK